MAGQTAVVVGGSRGHGLGVARAARDAGARVTVVARDLSPVADFDGEQGDATDDAFAAKVLAAKRPDLLVITAGVAPEMRPLTGHTWETFSANWHSDVRIAFVWLRAALALPLDRGSRVVVFGSAAELRGSPLSGGYAGAKAMVRLMTAYAAGQATDLGLTMTTVLPGITPHTTVGETAIGAYATASGITAEEFRARVSGAPSPESVGTQIVALAADPRAALAGAYLLDGDGLREHAG
ncbi:SDR family NAD(P)-dependent oxidoreductase [Actinoplanes sp. Pm04-4]|uniref:SDR family NAD(P)-dependent oxidoreductase n=1 Tax=Paractinoplanes pyxinae TaxID=2997416 RepID=A0ABT4AR48_9ACTN|nr:SDR family oxidoreductase [Actinoplanes pyxinae]MCY1136724.1 SDR family NAD(P)-dependent oxidoreductase [Actinoplanes pyxinae]